MVAERLPGEATPSVLVVDDDAMLRNLLVDVLSHEGYEVLTAACGEDALAMLETAAVDLVITDVVMPGISGVDVLRNARRRYPDIDVIVMTGYASVETAIRSIRLGAVDYITKPFSIEHIRVLVGKTIELARLRTAGRGTEGGSAGIDIATGLYNRTLFMDILDGELRSAARRALPLSLIAVDLDENADTETIDEAAWERAITLTSWSLRRSIRPGDRLGRVGPDRFAIILPDVGHPNVTMEQDRLRHELHHALQTQGLPIRLTLGSATFPTDARDAQTLVALAERAKRPSGSPRQLPPDEV